MKALSKPSAGQLTWQDAGVNTFNAREWSDGSLSPATFDPAGMPRSIKVSLGQ